MLTFEQFDKHINVIKDQYIKERKISKTLTDLGLFDGLIYINISEDIIENYIELIENLIGDTSDINNTYDYWVQWYIYENDFGKNKLNVTCGKYKDKQIRNNKDIYNIIVEWNKNKINNR